LASDATATVDLDVLSRLEFPIVDYEVSREKIAEYVGALGDRNPVHSDVGAAQQLGYKDIVAPPTFAAVFATRPFRVALADEEWVRRSTIDPSRILHGGQSFEFHRPVRPGDRLIIQSIVQDVYEKKNLVFLILATRVNAERAGPVLDATTTLIIRL
jgi:acyl dehydratase